MLKKILVMLVLLTAIFSPAELRASDYNPYADSVPIPETKEKKPAPKQPEPKQDTTVKKRPSPKKPTPRKKVSRPAKNENKTVKAKTNTPTQNNTAVDLQTTIYDNPIKRQPRKMTKEEIDKVIRQSSLYLAD